MSEPTLSPLRATRARLSKAIKTGPPHLRSIYQAVRDHGCSHLIITPEAGAFELAPDDSPMIAIVGDDWERSFGPESFDNASLRRLVARCTQAIIMAGFAPDIYHSAASWAVLCRDSVVIVETRSAHEIQWAAYLREAHPDISILHVLNPEDRPTA